MNQTSIKRPRILCVEDNPAIRALIKKALCEPSGFLCDIHRSSPFDVEFAETGSEGERLLRIAFESLAPYDGVLLDLELPELIGQIATVDTGLRVLRLATNDYATVGTSVVIQSGFKEFFNVRESVISGAADFVGKPYEDFEIFAAVANALHRVREKVTLNWEMLQRQKSLQWIVAQAVQKVEDEISVDYQSGLRPVYDHLDRLEQQLNNRFGLRLQEDNDDPFCEEVANLDTSVRAIPQIVIQRRSAFSKVQKELSKVNLVDLLQKEIRELRTGVLSRRIRLTSQLPAEPVFIETFQDEAEAIIRETLYEAIRTSPPESEIDVQVASRVGGKVGLTITDECPAIPDLDEYAKNHGRDWQRWEERPWISILARQVARNAGIGYEVRSHMSGENRGNSVLLQFMESING